MPEHLERAQRFAWELEAAYDEALVSVVLYGSAARGEYRPGASDLNLLVLLREVTAAALRRGTPLARRWREEGNPPPMILSLEEWRSSADVFAIEVTEIRDGHVVLAGASPFDGVEVTAADLRLQCERELKGKKIQLRERYLLVSDAPEELGELLTASFSTFLTLFRTVLRLAGDEAPRDPEALLRRLGERAGLAPDALLAIHRARVAGTPLRPVADDPVVTGYLEAVARVTAYVDRLAAAPH